MTTLSANGQAEMLGINEPPRVPAGILITRGVTPSFPPGALRISFREDGTPHVDARLHLHYDVCPVWLELALGHLIRAEEEHKALLSIWNSGDHDMAAPVLEAEFQAGMQAATAVCISLDALYANVKDLIPIPTEMKNGWSKRKTSRPAQVAEVFRRGFSMKQATASRLRDVLSQIYGFRDLIVHPSGETKESVLHPDLGVGVEWRFFSFGFTNVKEVVAGCLSITAQLLQKPKNTHKRLKQYCDGVRPCIEPLVAQWKTRYGTLYRRKEGDASR